MIHKLGNIYDCIYFLVKHHQDNPWKPDDDEEGDEDGDGGGDEDSEEEEEEEIDLEAMTDEEREAYEAELEAWDEKKEIWWFKLGIYYGTLVNLLLYVPDDWVDYDVTRDIENTASFMAANHLANRGKPFLSF